MVVTEKIKQNKTPHPKKQKQKQTNKKTTAVPLKTPSVRHVKKSELR